MRGHPCCFMAARFNEKKCKDISLSLPDTLLTRNVAGKLCVTGK